MYKYLSIDDITFYLNYLESSLTYKATASNWMYILPERFLNILTVDWVSESILQKISNDVCLFLWIMTELPKIDLLSNKKTNTPWLYNWNIQQPKIIINSNSEYNNLNYLAILIHEITHHYLSLRRIKFEDTNSNEILTDLTAIYLWFGHILQEGYSENENVYLNFYLIFSTRTTIKSRIWYIKSLDIRNALYIVNQKRWWPYNSILDAYKSISKKTINYSNDNNQELKRWLIAWWLIILFIVVVKVMSLYF